MTMTARRITTASVSLILGLYSLLTSAAVSAFSILPERVSYRRSRNSNNNNNNNNNRRNNMTSSSSPSSYDGLFFGPFRISPDHIFCRTSYSAAFCNLRPLVPGHVLVMPQRCVPLLADLTVEEYADLWRTVRVVQQDILQPMYTPDAFNIAIQDGKAAGQSVPHVHVHILPRKTGDYERNDDIYTDIEDWVPREEMRIRKQVDKMEVPDDSERVDRTTEQMLEEADQYRQILSAKTDRDKPKP